MSDTMQIGRGKGWTKQIIVDGQISYVNKIHEAIHAFLLDLCECECEYKYYISQKQWGFEIAGEYSRTLHRPYKAYLFIVDDTSATLAISGHPCTSQVTSLRLIPINAKHKDILGKYRVDLEIADPDFFTKIINFLKSNGLVTDEVHPKTET